MHSPPRGLSPAIYWTAISCFLLVTLRLAIPDWWGLTCDLNGHLHTIEAYRDAFRSGQLVPWIPDDGLGSPAAAAYGWWWYASHAVGALLLPATVTIAISQTAALLAFLLGLRGLARHLQLRHPDLVSLWAALLWAAQPVDGVSGVGLSTLAIGLLPAWTAQAMFPWLLVGLLRRSASTMTIALCVILASHPMSLIHAAILLVCTVPFVGGWRTLWSGGWRTALFMAPILGVMAVTAYQGFGIKIREEVALPYVIGISQALSTPILWPLILAWTGTIWASAFCCIRYPLCRAMTCYAIVGSAIASIAWLGSHTPTFFHPYRMLAPVSIALTCAILPLLDRVLREISEEAEMLPAKARVGGRVAVGFLGFFLPFMLLIAQLSYLPRAEISHQDFSGRFVADVLKFGDNKLTDRYPYLAPDSPRGGECVNGFHWITGSRTITSVCTASSTLGHPLHMATIGGPVWSQETARGVLRGLAIDRILYFDQGVQKAIPISNPASRAATCGDPIRLQVPRRGRIRLCIATWWSGYRAQHPDLPPAIVDDAGLPFPTQSLAPWDQRTEELTAQGTDISDAKAQVAQEFFARWDAWAATTLPRAPQGPVTPVPVITDVTGVRLVGEDRRSQWYHVLYEWSPLLRWTTAEIVAEEVGGCILVRASLPTRGEISVLTLFTSQAPWGASSGAAR